MSNECQSPKSKTEVGQTETFSHLIILALLDIWFFSQGGFLKDNKYYDLISENKTSYLTG